jgi:hypothetical protein
MPPAFRGSATHETTGNVLQQEELLATRAKFATVMFTRPFFLRKVNRELPAGSYVVETEEESLETVSTLSWRRVETRLFISRIVGKSDAEMWIISPGELDTALALDREPPSGPRQPDVVRSIPHAAAANRPIEELAMRDRNKGGNGPLYGACLGVLALLFATWVAHQLDRGVNPPPPAQTAEALSET